MTFFILIFLALFSPYNNEAREPECLNQELPTTQEGQSDEIRKVDNISDNLESEQTKNRSAIPLPPLSNEKKDQIVNQSTLLPYDEDLDTKIFPQEEMSIKEIRKIVESEATHYETLYAQTKKLARKSPLQCRRYLANYYKKESSWAHLNRVEKLKLVFKLTNDVYQFMQQESYSLQCQQFLLEYLRVSFIEKIKPQIIILLNKVLSHEKNYTFQNFYNLTRKVINHFSQKEEIAKIYFPKEMIPFKFEENLFVISWPLEIRSEKTYRRRYYKKHKKLNRSFYIYFMQEEISSSIANALIDKVNSILKERVAKITKERSYDNLALKLCVPLMDVLTSNDDDEEENNIDIPLNKENTARLQKIVEQFAENISKPQKKLSVLNAFHLHPKLTPHLARCVIMQETKTTFDPHTLNYTYCQRRNFMRSTAHGLGQTTLTTFKFLNRANLLPGLSKYIKHPLLRGKDNIPSDLLFELLNEHPQMQIETIFRHLNYLLKIKKEGNGQVLSAVVSYDLDNKSKYIAYVDRCLKCLDPHKYDDYEAALTCRK